MKTFKVQVEYARTEISRVTRTHIVIAKDETEAREKVRREEIDTWDDEEPDYGDCYDDSEEYECIDSVEVVGQDSHECPGCGKDTEGAEDDVACEACRCPVSGCTFEGVADECPDHVTPDEACEP
jgi:hypothetical protein